MRLRRANNKNFKVHVLKAEDVAELNEGADDEGGYIEELASIFTAPAAQPSKKNKPQKDGSGLVVVLCDVHIPDHDLPAWTATLQWISDHPVTEIILNGDFLELLSCSQHGGTPDITSLKSDMAAGRAALEELRTAAPTAKITYLQGNHETRLERFILAKAPALFGSLNLTIGLGLDDLGIEWVSEMNQPIHRGSLDILHGHQLSEYLPKHHAAKLADVYGAANRTAIIGHSHRAQTFHKPAYGGMQSAVAVGCLRTLRPGWTHGREGGWSHQFLVAYLDADGQSYCYPITVKNGNFIWNGKKYGG